MISPIQVNPGTQALIDPATHLGYVYLTVNNLDRQIQFYTEILGFQLHWRKEGEAALGTQEEILLRLSEDAAAKRTRNTSGMYHFAVLYPNRKELARVIARLFSLRYPNAPTDHGNSKTTYLDDPEGNNIELYIRSLEDGVMQVVNGDMVVRYADGRIGTGRDPLDLKTLFSELDENDRLDLPLPRGTRIGHVHLYSTGLEASLNFYANILGFQPGLMLTNFRMGEVGLDELQPHVIAFNTWRGQNIPPAPPNALGLRYFTLVVPSSDELNRVLERISSAGLPFEQTPEGTLVSDPSRINLIITDHEISLQ
ncbi:MAG: VOC family protein [Anaerolineae bacterium]|nr:VOC family protein [Anaerolineae bacterium]